MLISDIIKKFKILSVLFVSLAGLSACNDGVEGDSLKPEGSSLTLSFNLDTFTTRSSDGALNADGHPEEDETGQELTFYPGWLHVYVHDAITDELIFHINDATFSPLGSITKEEQPDGSLKVKVNTRSLMAGRSYRLSVMINCADKGGNLYAVDSSFQNDNDESIFLQAPHFIPYSGFTTFTVVPVLDGDRTQEIGNLWLLRSVARVEVQLSEDMRDKWKIESAILPGFGQKLYGFSYASAPLENIKKVKGTEYLRMEEMFNPHTVRMNATTKEDIEMGKVSDNYFRIYLPEQHNPLKGLAEEEEISMQITLVDRETSQKVNANLFIRNYPDSNPLNIVRNHIYRYTIKNVYVLHDVDVEVGLLILQPQSMVIDVPPFS